MDGKPWCHLADRARFQEEISPIQQILLIPSKIPLRAPSVFSVVNSPGRVRAFIPPPQTGTATAESSGSTPGTGTPAGR
jgi:hypothetical protein